MLANFAAGIFNFLDELSEEKGRRKVHCVVKDDENQNLDCVFFVGRDDGFENRFVDLKMRLEPFSIFPDPIKSWEIVVRVLSPDRDKFL